MVMVMVRVMASVRVRGRVKSVDGYSEYQPRFRSYCTCYVYATGSVSIATGYFLRNMCHSVAKKAAGSASW